MGNAQYTIRSCKIHGVSPSILGQSRVRVPHVEKDWRDAIAGRPITHPTFGWVTLSPGCAADGPTFLKVRVRQIGFGGCVVVGVTSDPTPLDTCDSLHTDHVWGWASDGAVWRAGERTAEWKHDQDVFGGFKSGTYVVIKARMPPLRRF